MLKKLCALGLVFAAFFTNVCAFAEGFSEVVHSGGGLAPVVCLNGGVSMYAANAEAPSDDTLNEAYRRIADCVANHNVSADLTDLKIPWSFQTEMGDLYGRAILMHPEGLAVSMYRVGKIRYTDGTAVVASVSPVYLADGDTYTEYRKAMDERVDYYVSLADDIPDSDIVGKLLVIHDKFVEENKYAQDELDAFNEATQHTAGEYVIFTAYGALVDKNAVCQGNTLALNLIYRKLNERLKTKLGVGYDLIGTGTCSSNEKNHIWNCIKVDGKWYQLDETWNDYEEQGSRYDFFMTSTKAFEESAESHGDPTEWEYYSYSGNEDIECSSNKYESGYIFNKNYRGTVSYADGKYNIDMTCYYVNGEFVVYGDLKNSFKASSSKSCGILLGEDYVRLNGLHMIEYYVTDDINKGISQIAADYSGGKMTEVHIRDLLDGASKGTVSYITLGSGMNGKTMYLWDFSSAKPVAERRIISGN